MRQLGQGGAESKETGWTVTRVPPGFIKIVDGFRRLRGTREVAHLVYSDGLVAVSVFIEPIGAALASDRSLPAGRHQCRHPAAGR